MAEVWDGLSGRWKRVREGSSEHLMSLDEEGLDDWYAQEAKDRDDEKIEDLMEDVLQRQIKSEEAIESIGDDSR